MLIANRILPCTNAVKNAQEFSPLQGAKDIFKTYFVSCNC